MQRNRRKVALVKQNRSVNLLRADSVKKPVLTEQGSKPKVIKYGDNNMLPHEIITAVCLSGTAKRCWRKLDYFLQADGFANVEEANKPVNTKGESADSVLDKISSDYSALDGFALLVKYTSGKTIGEVYHVPFQTVRKMDNGWFNVNPKRGTKQYRESEDVEIPPFNLETASESIATATTEEGSQRGQLLYVYRPTTDAPIYPVPDFWTEAGMNDILSDAQISRSDQRFLKKHTRLAGMVFIPGLDRQNQDEEGKTEFDYALEDLHDLTSEENEGEFLLTTGEVKEAAPTFSPIENTAALTSIDGKRDTIGRAVCRHFGMPPVLVGFSTAGQLGNNQEMLNSISLLQSEVNRKQRVIQRTFKQLFPEGEWMVSTLSPLKVIPEQIWATMTDDEKRNFLGLQEVESPRNEEADNLLQAIISLPDDLKAKVIENLTPEQILSLVGLKPTNSPQSNADNQS